MDRFLNKITCGDNCDLLGLLPRECIDLVVTSPPYDDLRTYGGHTWDFYGVAWQLKRVLKPGGVIVWVVADTTKSGTESGSSFEQALFFKRLGLNLHDTMIFEKQNPMPCQHNRYQPCCEYMFVFSKATPVTFNPILTDCTWEGGKGQQLQVMPDGAKRTFVKPNSGNKQKFLKQRWTYPVGSQRNGHPAPFPEQLAYDHIISWSNPGEIVLDPFAGSCTTAKAAIKAGRQFIAFEINPEYCNIGEARTAQEVLSFATV